MSHHERRFTIKRKIFTSPAEIDEFHDELKRRIAIKANGTTPAAVPTQPELHLYEDQPNVHVLPRLNEDEGDTGSGVTARGNTEQITKPVETGRIDPKLIEVVTALYQSGVNDQWFSIAICSVGIDPDDALEIQEHLKESRVEREANRKMILKHQLAINAASSFLADNTSYNTFNIYYGEALQPSYLPEVLFGYRDYKESLNTTARE